MDKQHTFGKYKTIELIGRGGFATVYKAKNTILGNEVALKVLDETLTTDEMFVRRFLQEAQQTVRLDHPNIMRVLDLEKVDEKLFIVMEYVPGQNLRDWLTQHTLSLEQTANIVRKIGTALDYAHSRKIIHRDVKPSNIMIRDDGQIKLADFGIAKAAEGAKLTLTGTTIGTPTYMSPEQSRGTEVDGRSDIYSLGIIAFELITGQVPFQGDTAAVIYKQIHEQPPLPSDFATLAKGPLDTVLLKALAKAPEKRYQTGKAFADELENAVRELQTKSLETIYDETLVLMKNYRYADALQELESLKAMHPNNQNVAHLLEQARQGIKLSKQYQEASDHLNAARKLVEEITAVDANFPDTENVLQVFRPRSTPSTWQSYLFWIGAATVIAVYFSTTWVWVTDVNINLTTDLVSETRQRAEGIATLMLPEIPWIIWLPLIATILSTILTISSGRPKKRKSRAVRPPINRTSVIATKAKKRSFSWLDLVIFVIVLLGLISTLFLIASFHSFMGPITITVGFAIMFIAKIAQFLQKE